VAKDAALAVAAPGGAALLPRAAAAAVVAENALLAVVFLAAVALPLAEIALRALLRVGIEGSTAIVQHLTLALGLLGAAVAAREERLLTLALSGLIAGPGAAAARFASAAVGAAVSTLLCLAAIEFVAIERASGNKLVGLPLWIAQLALPAGYGLIALRLAWRASPGLQGRAAAAALAAAAVAWLKLAPPDAPLLTVPALCALGAALLLGAPIFVAVGGAALFLLQGDGVPAAAVAVNHYSLVTNPSLPAIPMFTLAGYLLAESRAPGRLIELFDALFGRLRGGAALVTVLACTFFTCFTGASGVTILALGGLLMPLLASAGYRPKDALALVTGAGLPGVILAPALPLLLYGIVARVSIEDMFLGGLLPAALMLAIVAAWGVGRQPRRPAGAGFSWARARAALLAARWELSLPLVPIAALASGLATPVEAASITALYALFIVSAVHRELGLLRDVPRVVADCGLMVGGILLVLGVALGLTNYLVDAEVPDRLVEWVRRAIREPWVFLLALNAVLLAAGCVMDIFTAIVVLAPLVTPLGAAFGVHPVHLGIIFLANLELGYLTPPVGMNLFFASYRFGKPVAEVFRAVLPLFLALAGALLAITYLPWLSTLLPGLTGAVHP
jgi:tripartite ATP-independent transporter DctM subunit